MGYYYRIQLHSLVLHNTEFQGSQKYRLEVSLVYTGVFLPLTYIPSLCKTVTTISRLQGLGREFHTGTLVADGLPKVQFVVHSSWFKDNMADQPSSVIR